MDRLCDALFARVLCEAREPRAVAVCCRWRDVVMSRPDVRQHLMRFPRSAPGLWLRAMDTGLTPAATSALLHDVRTLRTAQRLMTPPGLTPLRAAARVSLRGRQCVGGIATVAATLACDAASSDALTPLLALLENCEDEMHAHPDPVVGANAWLVVPASQAWDECIPRHLVKTLFINAAAAAGRFGSRCLQYLMTRPFRHRLSDPLEGAGPFKNAVLIVALGALEFDGLPLLSDASDAADALDAPCRAASGGAPDVRQRLQATLAWLLAMGTRALGRDACLRCAWATAPRTMHSMALPLRKAVPAARGEATATSGARNVAVAEAEDDAQLSVAHLTLLLGARDTDALRALHAHLGGDAMSALIRAAGGLPRRRHVQEIDEHADLL